jgi:hypothetical protein
MLIIYDILKFLNCVVLKPLTFRQPSNHQFTFSA